MPKADLLGALAQARVTGNADLAVARKIANQFRVSMRAAVLRLVDVERATWSLFHAIRRLPTASGLGASRQGSLVGQATAG